MNSGGFGYVCWILPVPSVAPDPMWPIRLLGVDVISGGVPKRI
jgi:hypothetical protein